MVGHSIKSYLRAVFFSLISINRQLAIIRSFAVGPRVWNSLPAPLRDTNSIYSFREQLKTFLVAHSDYVFASYKYSYLLTYLLYWRYIELNPSPTYPSLLFFSLQTQNAPFLQILPTRSSPPIGLLSRTVDCSTALF